jgi:flagellar motility protein MotE (MotC chaperone)
MEERVKPALLAKQSHDREKADALLNALSTLPARKASAIIAKAEPEIAAMLLGQLGPEKSAGILAVMEPATAAMLVQRLVKPAAKGSDTTAEAGTNNAKSRSGTENP